MGRLSTTSLKVRDFHAIKLPSLREIVLVALLISLYTQVPLQITDTVFIPSFVTLLIVAPVMLLMVGQKVYEYEVAFVLSLFTLLLLSAFLSPGFEFIGQKLLGLFQTMVSVSVGVLTLKFLGRISRSRVATVLFLLSLFLAAGSLLEVASVLRPASDFFREVAYGDSLFTVYEAETRDAQITGFERAKFFTPEPSVLTKGFFVFVNAWLLVSYNKRNLLMGLLLTALLFFSTGSLVLVASAVVSLSVMLMNERSVLNFAVLVLGVTAMFLGAFSAFPEVFANAVARFQEAYAIGYNVSLLANDSIGLRLILPMLTLIEVWRSSPLFGVGISGKEVVGELTGLYVSPSFGQANASLINPLGNNNLTSLLTYLGVVGTVALVFIFLWYLRKLRVRSVIFLFWIVAVFSLTGGGFEEPRYWGYVFVLIWAVKERDNEAEARPKRTKSSENGGPPARMKATFRAKSSGPLAGRRVL